MNGRSTGNEAFVTWSMAFAVVTIVFVLFFVAYCNKEDPTSLDLYAPLDVDVEETKLCDPDDPNSIFLVDEYAIGGDGTLERPWIIADLDQGADCFIITPGYYIRLADYVRKKNEEAIEASRPIED